MPRFMLRPLETLYFGPPVSFSAGEAHHGVSLFPPPLWAFQGLIRTRLLCGAREVLDLDDWSEAAKRQREELVGGPDRLPSSWQMIGPYPMETIASEWGESSTRLWFRTPRFLLRLPGKPAQARVIESTQAAIDDLQATDFHPVGAPTLSRQQTLEGWISSHNLRWALTGEGAWRAQEHSANEDLPHFVTYENHAGVEVERRKTQAKHGMLYFLRTLRLKDRCGFYGQLEGDFDTRLDPSCLTHGTGRAGRGGRLVAFEPLPGDDPDWEYLMRGVYLPDQLSDSNRLWVVLLTPALIPAPFAPPLPTEPGISVTVQAALLGPPVVLGGYSIANRDVRPNQAYVPAGSAWLVNLTGGTRSQRAQVVRNWNGKHILGPTTESALAAFGFGHILVGVDRA